MKILVTGSTGLLGGTLLPIARQVNAEVVGHGHRSEADVRADLSLQQEAFVMLDLVMPDVIINLVCLSDIDACERDPDKAYLVNVTCLEHVAKWVCSHRGTKLIQISTDQLYDGPGLNTENNVTLKNVYATTKLSAEKIALEVGGIVLRTNFFGPSRVATKRSFSDWLIAGFKVKAPRILFVDVLFNPLSMTTLSNLILFVIEHYNPGLYNLGSREGMSKRDFAHALAARFGFSLEGARDGKVRELGLLAIRPKNMIMDVTAFEKNFSVQLPTLKEEIENMETDV